MMVSGCKTVFDDTRGDAIVRTAGIIVVLPLVPILAAIYLTAPVKNSVKESYTYSIEEFVQDNPCIQPYKAKREDIDNFVFVISDPVTCRAAPKTPIHFNEGRIYYFKADKEQERPTYEITGAAYTCAATQKINSQTLSCYPLQTFEIRNLEDPKSPSDIIFTKAGNTLSYDNTIEWPRLYKYSKKCAKPMFEAGTLPNEDILVGLFNDEYGKKTFSGQACNFRMIRKIPRSSLK
jgi:hypothetical protein